MHRWHVLESIGLKAGLGIMGVVVSEGMSAAGFCFGGDFFFERCCRVQPFPSGGSESGDDGTCSTQRVNQCVLMI